MRDNSFDRTIERNYIQKWRFLIAEYEEVKAGTLFLKQISSIHNLTRSQARSLLSIARFLIIGSQVRALVPHQAFQALVELADAAVAAFYSSFYANESRQVLNSPRIQFSAGGATAVSILVDLLGAYA
jgi:hypothetical protein